LVGLAPLFLLHDAFDGLPQLPPGLRIHPRSWLIQQHQLWLPQHRYRYLELPLVPATELLGLAVGIDLEVHLLNFLPDDSLHQLAVPDPFEGRKVVQVLPHSHLFHHNAFLRAVPNAYMADDVAHVSDGAQFSHQDAPRVLGSEPSEQVEERGLASPIRAQQAEALSHLHVYVQIADPYHPFSLLQALRGTVVLLDLKDLDQARHAQILLTFHLLVRLLVLRVDLLLAVRAALLQVLEQLELDPNHPE